MLPEVCVELLEVGDSGLSRQVIDNNRLIGITIKRRPLPDARRVIAVLVQIGLCVGRGMWDDG